MAERQHGVVTLCQLKAFGIGANAAKKRAATGRFHRIHRGVYAVGHAPLTARARWIAAVLAYGPGAVVSHRTAAALLGLRPSARARIDVTVPRRSVRPRPGIEVHASLTLAPQDVIAADGIPCTSVARTLVDLGDVEGRRAVEKAVDQAEVQRVFDLAAVREVLARAGPRRGAGVLADVIAGWAGPTLTDRELEERFLAICRAAGVPQPAVNEWLVLGDGEVKVDFLWRAERLAIETDGWAAHGTRRAFSRDRARDRRLKLAGYDSHRFTWDEVTERPGEVAITLRALLAPRRAAA